MNRGPGSFALQSLGLREQPRGKGQQMGEVPASLTTLILQQWWRVTPQVHPMVGPMDMSPLQGNTLQKGKLGR